MRFDRYTVTMLTLRPDAPAMTDDEASALQDRHLAHGADLQDRGIILARGPLVEQDDERFRGLSIWSVDAATARQHAEADPAVRVGRLAVEVMTWMMPAGNLAFSRVRAPRSLAEAASAEREDEAASAEPEDEAAAKRDGNTAGADERAGADEKAGQGQWQAPMLDRFNLDDLATALADQSADGYDFRWLLDTRTGKADFWSRDLEDRDIEDELDPAMIEIEALPSRVWYRDMADFAALVSDETIRERLRRALDGKGAFRRFNDELHQRQAHLVAPWRAFRERRAAGHAVDWLRDNELIGDDVADRYLSAHPDPDAIP